MGPGPIPWRDILRFSQFYGLDEEMFPIFNRVIRAMDTAYLEYLGKKKPKNG